MSIDFYAHLHKKCLTQKTLYDIILEHFVPNNKILQQKRERCIFYNGFDNDNSIDIAFVEQTTFPYIYYQSDLLNRNFYYEQDIVFGIAKEKYSIDTYKKIINFCIFLKSQINTDILVSSDAHNEICFLHKKGIVWAKDSLFIRH